MEPTTAPEIIYEDVDIIVVNKPSGMIVYPDGKHDYPALSTWLDKKYAEGNLPDGKAGFHFVHRIDRETSGVLVVAKNEKAHEFLKEQFKEREVQKTYRAFVHGSITAERGIIDKPIGSARGGLGPRSAKLPHGTVREALTLYRTIGSGHGATYVEVFPKTGRTHQIRVHFSAIGHPILHDGMYGPGREQLLGFTRLALHALSIRITLPSGLEKTFTAPLPPDFIAAEGELRKA